MRSGSAAAILSACSGSNQEAIRTGTRPSAVGIVISSSGLSGHQLGQAVAEPRSRAERAAGDVDVGLILVPMAAGDVEMDPWASLHELADEHRGGDEAGLAVVRVLQVGALALDELPADGVDRQPPDPVAPAPAGPGHH